MSQVITICTGNICRSPAAQIALQGYLGDVMTVASAGTHALVGHAIPLQMLEQLALGGHAGDGQAFGNLAGDGHAARQFTGALAREADLVIAMTSAHRRWVVSEEPRALKKTFLLMEIAAAARIGAPLPGATLAERAANIGAAVSASRPELSAFEIADIPDPYGKSDEDYAESFAMIRDAVRDIAAWVRQV